MLWTNKYAPKGISEIAGQDDALLQLKDFIINFNKQKNKAALLFGPVGSGKSCSVYALAKELNYEVFEVNASDIRNADAIYNIVGAAIKQKSIFFKEKIILIDELDGISGKADFGGLAAISALIKETKFPIILVSNDGFDERFNQIRKSCRLIEFKRLGFETIFSVLKDICKKEGIAYEDSALKTLSMRSAGDLRGAINDLQMISFSGNVKNEFVEHIAEREKEEKIERALLKIFKTTDIKVALSAFDYVDEDPNKLLLWIDENLPKEYAPKELGLAYKYLSLADIYNRRIKRRQEWRYLVYINVFLTAGIALSKEKRYEKIANYRPSKRILKIWIANQRYAKRKAIAEKIADATHCSTKKAMEVIPYMRIMFKKNKNETISQELGLGTDEREWLEK